MEHIYYLSGIYGSAIQVSKDSEVFERGFTKVQRISLSMLKTIGITQMETELFKKFKPVLRKTERLQESDEEHLEQEDVRLLIRDVLNEIEAEPAAENLIAILLSKVSKSLTPVFLMDIHYLI